MNNDTKLRIAEVEVKSLFGLYDHSIKLFLEDRVTIVHGQNGVGKTALLRLIEALVRGKYIQLIKTPLDSFCLRLVHLAKNALHQSQSQIGFAKGRRCLREFRGISESW